MVFCGGNNTESQISAVLLKGANMTDKQKAELIMLVEQGSRAEVGYYNSACVMFERNGQICAEKWGFALIGKFRDPTVAYRKYKESHDLLPTSNPGCLQMIYAVAQLLGIENWKELVEIHYACHDNSDRREDEVAEFTKVVLYPNRHLWAQAVMPEAFQNFENKLIGMKPERMASGGNIGRMRELSPVRLFL
jgi:hypothetical protein